MRCFPLVPGLEDRPSVGSVGRRNRTQHQPLTVTAPENESSSNNDDTNSTNKMAAGRSEIQNGVSSSITCSDSAARRDAGGYEQPTYALRLPQAHLGTDLNDSVELATERKYLSIVNEDTT